MAYPEQTVSLDEQKSAWMMVLRIPHKWTHFFYTMFTGWFLGRENSYALFSCSKCKKTYAMEER